MRVLPAAIGAIVYALLSGVTGAILIPRGLLLENFIAFAVLTVLFAMYVNKFGANR